ncbi:MAG TPA: hypothetical protein VGF99_13705 [Myxococcota bacterium]
MKKLVVAAVAVVSFAAAVVAVAVGITEGPGTPPKIPRVLATDAGL